MPVSTLLSTFNGRMPKYRCAMVMNVLVSGGTTEPMTMPVTLLASIARCSNSCATQMPISSDVRSRSVASRQLSMSRSPSNTPRTMFVLPTSIARSILLQLSALSSQLFHKPTHFTCNHPLDLPPTRTSSAPCRSMSCARPRTTPAGESHSTCAPGRDAREPPPGAQNSIEPSGTQIGVPLAHRRKNLGEHQRAIGGPRRFRFDRRDTRRELRRIRGRLQIHAERRPRRTAARRPARPPPRECPRACGRRSAHRSAT